MSKQSGLGMRLYVAGYNLSGDVNAINRISGGPAALDMTDITQSANARDGGTITGGLEFASFFNKASGRAHPVLSALPRTDVHALCLTGLALGDHAAGCVGKQVNYDGSRGTDGSLLFTTTIESNGFGLEWGNLLTADLRTDTGAASGTGVDFAAATAFGLQAHLEVTAFTGTDATIKIQESSDNGSPDTFADVVGGAFTQITTGPTTQRIQTARTLAVERYLRVVTTTSAGFSSLSFVVMVAKNETLVNL